MGDCDSKWLASVVAKEVAAAMGFFGDKGPDLDVVFG